MTYRAGLSQQVLGQLGDFPAKALDALNQDGGSHAGAASDAFRTDRRNGSCRVTLRPLISRDQGEFLDLAAASVDLHRPWMSLPATPQEFQAYLSRYERPTEESQLICVRQTAPSPAW